MKETTSKSGMSIYMRLANVQKNLKAPKGQYNTFGKYKYRSCEDIIEAAKPLCIENGLLLTLGDEVTQVGERFYVRATATVIDVETGESYGQSALAREEDGKKGMDGSQVTGTASTYARKYALNGLFAIDDTKDADTDEVTQQWRNGGGNSDSGNKCAACGKSIEAAFAQRTKADFGRPLCQECANREYYARQQRAAQNAPQSP